ncbi:MAG: VWA domain-containing protein, partial [Comamonadaceae bacterium]
MNHTIPPSILLMPLRQAVPEAASTLEVLVRVQAPDARPEGLAGSSRAPLRLAVVIDRSGSMSGQPLQEAMRCAQYLAGALQSTDHIGVVLYDSDVQVPVRLGPAGLPDDVRLALA